MELWKAPIKFAYFTNLRYYIDFNIGYFINLNSIYIFDVKLEQVLNLAPDEIQEIKNKGVGQRKLVEQQYDAILSDYEVGEYGEAILDEGENRLTVRNRMKAAAGRRGLGITFRRTSGDMIRFQITEKSESAAAAPVEPPPVVSSEPPAPAKRKGGRPKKTV